MKNIVIIFLIIIVVTLTSFIVYDKFFQEGNNDTTKENIIYKEPSASELYKNYVDNISKTSEINNNTFLVNSNSYFYQIVLNEEGKLDFYIKADSHINFISPEDEDKLYSLNTYIGEMTGIDTLIHTLDLESVVSIHNFSYSQDLSDLVFFLTESGEVYYFSNSEQIGISQFNEEGEINIHKSEKLNNIVSFLTHGVNINMVSAVDVMGNVINFDEI